MLTVAYRSERKEVFFEKDLDRKHFKKTTTKQCTTLPF